jgi:hypothetical protein
MTHPEQNAYNSTDWYQTHGDARNAYRRDRYKATYPSLDAKHVHIGKQYRPPTFESRASDGAFASLMRPPSQDAERVQAALINGPAETLTPMRIAVCAAAAAALILLAVRYA